MKVNKKLIRAHAALLASLERSIEQLSDPEIHSASAPGVSAWSVKDHLEHLSVADHGIVTFIERVRDGHPDLETGGRPNLLGRLVLLVGGFPRGRGKAPERTLPDGKPIEEVTERFRRIRTRVEALEPDLGAIQAARYRRNHFAFGDLNAVEWLRFAVIHDHHHRKIIRDILRAADA